ncbi:MAG: hypothetical protein ACP5KN_20030 [Armatimonadota bacterium]
MRILLTVLCMLMVMSCVAQDAEEEPAGPTALEQLEQAQNPTFAEGHTLLPLSMWMPEQPFEVRKELADNWGYCLRFGRLRPQLVEQLEDPESVVSRVCELTAGDPERYPMHVIVAPAFTIRSFRDELPPETWCRDENGELVEGKQIWSPEAPDEAFEMVAEREIEMLRPVLERAPIAIITNGGEYGLSTVGHHLQYWQQDPKVMAAKGDRDWYDYISQRKGHQELIVSERIRELVPERMLYIYYHTEASHHAHRYADWWKWTWDYDYMKPVSDIPNTSIYYRHYNSGFTGSWDMLTMALNATAQQIEYGQPLSYNWVTAGWPGENRPDEPIADPARYMGYLKCYYTAGMIGGVAGYFAYDDARNWIWQCMALGRVHALFSHLEDFLRNGDLVPGPERHVWSEDLAAYELPTGVEGVRALARKHREREEWLVAAWAAGTEACTVEVEVPELGTVSLQARPSGSVYRGSVEDGRPALTLIDEDGLLPTAGL